MSRLTDADLAALDSHPSVLVARLVADLRAERAETARLLGRLEDTLPILNRDKSERSLELQTSIERALAAGARVSDSAEQAAWEQEALAAFHAVQYGPDGLSGGHIDSWVRGAHWGREQAAREAAVDEAARQHAEPFAGSDGLAVGLHALSRHVFKAGADWQREQAGHRDPAWEEQWDGAFQAGIAVGREQAIREVVAWLRLQMVSRTARDVATWDDAADELEHGALTAPAETPADA